MEPLDPGIWYSLSRLTPDERMENLLHAVAAEENPVRYLRVIKCFHRRCTKMVKRQLPGPWPIYCSYACGAKAQPGFTISVRYE
jgi:hypothetical protein